MRIYYTHLCGKYQGRSWCGSSTSQLLVCATHPPRWRATTARLVSRLPGQLLPSALHQRVCVCCAHPHAKRPAAHLICEQHQPSFCALAVDSTRSMAPPPLYGLHLPQRLRLLPRRLAQVCALSIRTSAESIASAAAHRGAELASTQHMCVHDHTHTHAHISAPTAHLAPIF